MINSKPQYTSTDKLLQKAVGKRGKRFKSRIAAKLFNRKKEVVLDSAPPTCYRCKYCERTFGHCMKMLPFASHVNPVTGTTHRVRVRKAKKSDKMEYQRLERGKCGPNGIFYEAA